VRALAADPESLVVATWRLPAHTMAQIERVTLPVERRSRALAVLREDLGLDGVYYLATCQRVLTAFLKDSRRDLDGEALGAAMARACGAEEAVVAPEIHRSDGALRHMARVAASFESFVPGEPQVLGQFKAAYNFCAEARLLSPRLDWVIQRVVHAAKQVRTETNFFSGKVSTLPLALNILREGLDGGGAAAVVGCGRMGAQMVSLLRRKFRDADMHVVSRSARRARDWARECEATPWRLDAFLRDPPALNVLVLAGEAPAPYLTVGVASRLRDAAENCGLTIVDLGLPRNCEPEVGSLPGIRLVQMDDLAREAEKGKAVRSRAEVEARAILDEEVRKILQRARRQGRDRRIGLLRAEIVDAGRRRLSELPPALRSTLGSDPAFLKWYEQSLKAVAHVSMKRTRELLEEVEEHGDD
jgi:glutamyl-tRNA reductase